MTEFHKYSVWGVITFQKRILHLKKNGNYTMLIQKKEGVDNQGRIVVTDVFSGTQRYYKGKIKSIAPVNYQCITVNRKQ